MVHQRSLGQIMNIRLWQKKTNLGVHHYMTMVGTKARRERLWCWDTSAACQAIGFLSAYCYHQAPAPRGRPRKRWKPLSSLTWRLLELVQTGTLLHSADPAGDRQKCQSTPTPIVTSDRDLMMKMMMMGKEGNKTAHFLFMCHDCFSALWGISIEITLYRRRWRSFYVAPLPAVTYRSWMIYDLARTHILRN